MRVDVLITTTGRRSLEQAIVAALHQTYPLTRCVVVSDGTNDKARAIFDYLTRGLGGLYLETPRKLGAGNRVKYWYLNSEHPSPYVKFLDDDDWIPPVCIAEMMRPIERDPTVVMTLCNVATLFVPGREAKRFRISESIFKRGLIGSGAALVSSEAARGVEFPEKPDSDFFFLEKVAEKGRVIHTRWPLYWYNAYRTNKERHGCK